ncbi:hypothetical protein D9601_02460 [Sphingomonas sp. MA1305]|uniref:hypothetical protein n=1 Tax=Sphingomonas sp. MA1305 TaxID=2479204 RepID=UPI0018DF77DC|nr:hypothetical protein [Sphingomonas sp. MA1305]MBI0474228.1 hypothetical protein [Sphingomonas sp. MA1305]
MSEEQIVDTGADAGDVADAGDASADAPRQLTEVEQLAKDMGWDPEYKGSQGKPPRSAQDWIKSTDRRNKNLSREVETLRSSIERIVDATDKQVKREVERRAQEIEERFSAAVDSGDKQAAARAAQEMRDLEAEAQPTSKGRDYEADFARDNPWYGKDEEASAYAVTIAQREAGKGAKPEQQLEAAAAAVRKRFPELFDEQPKREEPKTPLVHAPSRTMRERRSTGFADMPEVARLAANRFYEAAKMRGTAPDRKDFEAKYAKDYFSDQAA